MKYCPRCRTEYADDSLQFCLQDGAPLAGASNQSTTNAFDTDAETLVVPKQVEPIRFEPPSSYQTNQANWQSSQPIVIEQPVVPSAAKKSNTATIVLLSVLGTILILGLGGLGTWLYFRNSKPNIVSNANTASANRPATNANTAAPNNQNANVNANAAKPSPSATATPRPSLNPEEAQNVITDVEYLIDDWEEASENLDLDRNMKNYADTVDYYKGGKIGVSRVRADKERAFSAYDSININISNVKITPDDSGERATAVFDKEWTFEGENKYSSGKVQQQLMFVKAGEKWLISGEKDLKVYYVNQ